MLSTFKKAWEIPQLRKKMIFTLLMLLVYRLGSHIAVPYMDGEAIRQLFNSGNQTYFHF